MRCRPGASNWQTIQAKGRVIEMQTLPDRSEFEGWRLEPQWGADFKGVRGSRRDCVGWVATHIKTNHRIEFKPDVSGDRSRQSVEDALRIKNELYEATGHF